MAQKSLVSRAFGAVSSASTLWGLLPSSLQVWLAGGVSLVTAGFGFWSYGVFYALVGASVVFAFALVAIFAWIGIRRVTTVFERLTVEQLAVINSHLHELKDGRNRKKWVLRNATYELHLKNLSATQTLYFQLKRVAHQLDGKSVSGPAKFTKDIFVLPPQVIQKMMFASLPDVDIKDNLKGYLELEALYGPKRDDLRYQFTYHSEPGISAYIDKKRGNSQLQVTCPILKVSHDTAA